MGGPTGKVSFPAGLAEFHQGTPAAGLPLAAKSMLGVADFSAATGAAIIDIDLMSTLVTMMDTGGNPFASVNAFNPDTILSKTEDRVDAFVSLAETIDQSADWEAMCLTALNRADSILAADELEVEVANFESKSEGELARGYNRITAGFFDINAVVSTSFPAGLASLEEQHRANVSRFRTERTVQRARERSFVVMQSISDMVQLFSLKIQAESGAAQLQQQSGFQKIAVKDSQTATDVGFNVDESNYNLETLKSGSTVLAALNNAPIVPKGLTRAQSALSGLTAGAGFGINIGIATGNFGIGAIGALVGGALGALSGVDAFESPA